MATKISRAERAPPRPLPVVVHSVQQCLLRLHCDYLTVINPMEANNSSESCNTVQCLMGRCSDNPHSSTNSTTLILMYHLKESQLKLKIHLAASKNRKIVQSFTFWDLKSNSPAYCNNCTTVTQCLDS